MEIAVINQKKETVGNLSLNPEFWQNSYSFDTVSLAIRSYLANKRQATSKVKTRGEVSGGGRKPWRQKGTGRARQGSTRSPHWVHGGVGHGPTGKKNYTFDVNKKVKKRAFQSIISKKYKDQEIMVINQINLTNYKTKEAFKLLTQLELNDKKVLIVLSIKESKDEQTKRSFRNLSKISLSSSKLVNVYEIVNHPKLLITQEAFGEIERRL